MFAALSFNRSSGLSIFPRLVEIGECSDEKIERLAALRDESHPEPELVGLAKSGSYSSIAAQVQAGAYVNLANLYYLAPLHAAVYCSDLKASYLTTKTLIELGANVNVGLLTRQTDYKYKIDPEDGHTILYKPLVLDTPLALAIEGNWPRSASVIQLLVLKGGVVYHSISPAGQERVNLAMLQLFNQQKLMYVSLTDPDCLFNKWPKELIQLIIKVSVFSCHTFTDLPENSLQGTNSANNFLQRVGDVANNCIDVLAEVFSAFFNITKSA